MEDLIKALQILSKYTKEEFPTNCEDELFHVDVDPEIVSKEDIDALNELDFHVSGESSGFDSHRFGSC